MTFQQESSFRSIKFYEGEICTSLGYPVFLESKFEPLVPLVCRIFTKKTIEYKIQNMIKFISNIDRY